MPTYCIKSLCDEIKISQCVNTVFNFTSLTCVDTVEEPYTDVTTYDIFILVFEKCVGLMNSKVNTVQPLLANQAANNRRTDGQMKGKR